MNLVTSSQSEANFYLLKVHDCDKPYAQVAIFDKGILACIGNNTFWLFFIHLSVLGFRQTEELFFHTLWISCPS